MVFHQAQGVTHVREILMEFPQTIVFWDVDHKKAGSDTDPLSAKAVGLTLLREIAPDRVFAISDVPLNRMAYLLNMPAFGHHIYRNYEGPAAEICSRLAMACIAQDPFSSERYLPEGSKFQKIWLKNSDQKGAAIEAVSNVFNRLGMPPRLGTMATQGADELLMNAIFDAPVDEDGNYCQRMVERNHSILLVGRAQVELEIGIGDQYVMISVSDLFGSIKKEVVQSLIRNDYTKVSYRPRESDPGAGLGIYGMIQSGLSLLFVCKPGSLTKVTIFVPRVHNFRSFRTGFRFCSFITR